MRTTAFVILLSIVSLATAVSAGVPGLINYQGTLTDPYGTALTDTVSMTFSIYTAPMGGALMWTEVQPSVVVTDGLFNVLLGSVNVIIDTVFAEPERWLSIQVESDPELTPRQRIASVAYALVSGTGGTGSDGDWVVLGDDIYSAVSGKVGIGTATPDAKLDVRNTAGDGRAGSFTIENAGNDSSALYAATNGSGTAVYGEHNGDFYGYLASDSCGVYGHGTLSGYGVYGERGANYGYLGGLNFGVFGFGDLWDQAVYGLHTDGNFGYLGGISYGAHGRSYGGLGVYGISSLGGKGVYGAYDENNNYGYIGSADHGVYGRHDNTGNYGYLGSDSCGVYGYSASGDYGVYGAKGGNYGYLGSYTLGIYGFCDYLEGRAVYGQHGDGNFGYLGGMSHGVRGFTYGGLGVYGTSEMGGYGVYGNYNPSHNYGYIASDQLGVYGEHYDTGNYGYLASDTCAVYGFGNSGYAGYFDGSVQIRENLWLGTSAYDGLFEINRYGSVSSIVRMGDLYNDGGALHMLDAAGHFCAFLEPDVSTGGGAWFSLYSGGGNYGFQVDGNYIGTEDPKVSIMGASRSATFSMSSSGNSSVVLPPDAIAAAEMYDEPGVASNTGSGFTLAGGIEVQLSRSISCPTSGYVLVMGTCEATVYHTTGTTSNAYFGVSDTSSSFPINQDVELRMSSAAPTATYDFPVTVHGLFQVNAGTRTFHLLAQEISGNYITYDTQLSLVFFPTAYGTVLPTLAMGPDLPDEQVQQGVPLTPGDITAQRAESEAANDARIERELANMRVELEGLRREVRNHNR